jgi:sRNA-binding protein
MTETPPVAPDDQALPAVEVAAPLPVPVPEAVPVAGGHDDVPALPASPQEPAVPAAAALPDLSPAACAAELAARFPALFGAGRALPIKLRIQADIQARAPGVFSRKSLSLFLHRHTTSTAYLKALVSSPTRFDLDGVAAGDVADEHRQAAAAEVERRRAIVEARRMAERDAARLAQRQADAARREQARAHSPQAPAPAGEAGAARPPRAPRPTRPPRPPRPPTARPPMRPEDSVRPPRVPPQQAAPMPPMPPVTPEPLDAAQRERALLLRTYEGSTLTRANFCALKRMSESELEGQLTLARQEREQRAPAPPRPPNRS